MFKFDFQLDDGEDQETDQPVNHDEKRSHPPSTSIPTELPHQEVALDALLAILPDSISFSPLVIPALEPRDEPVVLARRDLFDARFQLLAHGAGEETGPQEAEEDNTSQALRFVDAPSDLVRGVYEGGMKTWECAVDLAAYLHARRAALLGEVPKGKRILEIGCGTAVPSLYVLHHLFSRDHVPAYITEIHLQDYNQAVLELVTLPNILLAWYMSSASSSFRASQPTTRDDDSDELPPADASVPGELPVSPELLQAFRSSLGEQRVTLRFFSGGWSTFEVPHVGGPYDLLLTSETIYQADALRSLVDLLYSASDEGLSPEVVNKANHDNPTDALGNALQAKLSLGGKESVCLVAAKILYFGVGGGMSDFIREVKQPNGPGQRRIGRVETVWNQSTGVNRCIMRAIW